MAIKMKRRKFTTAEKVTLTILGVLMAAVIGVGAYLIISNVNKANYEATNTTHTTIKIVTTAIPETTVEHAATEKIISKPEKKESKTSSAKTASTSKSTKSTDKKTKSKTTSSKTTRSSAGDNPAKISVITPKKNTEHKSSEKCVINGTTCYVGDTISVTLNLKSSKVLENYQGYSEFDSNYLSCKSVKSTTGITNHKGSKIYYNASVITGMDFTSGGTVYTAEFKIKKAGSTTLTNTFELLTDIDDKDVKPSSVKGNISIFS
jgi:type II secretory pathway pseudopilin PulG